MKYQSHIQNSRREPFIGPCCHDNKPKQVAVAVIVLTIVLAVTYAVTWLAMELHKLS